MMAGRDSRLEHIGEGESDSSGISSTGESDMIAGKARYFAPVTPALFRSSDHGGEVAPAVQRHHHQVARDEGGQAAHRREMPDSHRAEAAEGGDQPGELDR